MKTAEVTRNKTLAKVAKGAAPGATAVPSTFGLFMEIYKKDGIRGINKGVNAVALRQVSSPVLRFDRVRQLLMLIAGDELGESDRNCSRRRADDQGTRPQEARRAAHADGEGYGERDRCVRAESARKRGSCRH